MVMGHSLTGMALSAAKIINNVALANMNMACDRCGFTTSAMAVLTSCVHCYTGTLQHHSSLTTTGVQSSMGQASTDSISALNNGEHRLRFEIDHGCKTAQVCCDRYSAAASPARRLPPELLSEIFLLSLPVDWKVDSPGNKLVVMRPSHICKYWRNVALTTPRLWSLISIEISWFDALYRIERKVALARKWLSRTAKCPLSVRISFDMQPSYRRAALSLLEPLLQNCDRWQHAEINLPWSTVQRLNPAGNILPLLESLVMSVRSHHKDRLLGFEAAPNLRNYNGCGPAEIQLQWRQLTHCFLDYFINSRQALMILASSPNLVTFGVKIASRAMLGADVLPTNLTIHHQNLRSLTILGEGNFRSLLDPLILPSLKELKYREEGRYLGPAPVVDLMTRSSCSIISFGLELVAEGMGSYGLIFLLEHMPELSELDLQLHFFTEIDFRRILTRLMARPQSGKVSLLPRLEILKIDHEGALDYSLLANTLESRWRMWQESVLLSGDLKLQKPLRTVEVRGIRDEDDLDDYDISRFIDLVSKGLDIKLWVEDTLYGESWI